MKGFVDDAREGKWIGGWVAPAPGGELVRVRAVADGEIIGEAVADRARKDVVGAGFVVLVHRPFEMSSVVDGGVRLIADDGTVLPVWKGLNGDNPAPKAGAPARSQAPAESLPTQGLLTTLANRYGSDKGNAHLNPHFYTRVYEEIFAPLKSLPIRLLEIGLLRPNDPRWAGKGRPPHYGGRTATAAPSLAMWAEYFQLGEIHGFDLNDFSDVHVDRCCIHRGDSGNLDDLARVAAHGPFDVIIDDASHASPHQQVALGALFGSVRPGGYYIIEDLTWQPEGLERDGVSNTLNVLQSLERGLGVPSPLIPAEAADAIVRDCECVMFFDSLGSRGALAQRDALCVIRKAEIV